MKRMKKNTTCFCLAFMEHNVMLLRKGYYYYYWWLIIVKPFWSHVFVKGFFRLGHAKTLVHSGRESVFLTFTIHCEPVKCFIIRNTYLTIIQLLGGSIGSNDFSTIITPQKFNSLPLKINGWKTNIFLLGFGNFSGAVQKENLGNWSLKCYWSLLLVPV